MNIDWDGKGLPPVGATVEVLWSSMKPAYVICIILAHDDGRALFRFTSGERKGEYQAESNRPIQNFPNFRPLKTAEELAAEQKAAERKCAIELIIEDLRLTNGNGWYSIAEDLYDRGYRKFEIVEEDV